MRLFYAAFLPLILFLSISVTSNAQEPSTMPQPIPGSVQRLGASEISWNATTNQLAYVPEQPAEDMVANAQGETSGYIALWQPELNPLADTMTLDSTRVERLPVMPGSPQSTDSLQVAFPHSPDFNPTGTLLATRQPTGLVMYDVQEAALLFSLQQILDVVWSPDGTRFISQNLALPYTADIWDARTGDLLASYPLFPTPSNLRFEQLAFSWGTADEVVMSGMTGSNIRAILDLNTGQVHNIPNCCPSEAPRLLWQPGGRLLAMHDAIYDLDTQRVLFTFPSQPNNIYWSPDGQLLVGTFLDQVSIISVAEGRIIAQFTTAALGEGHIVSDVEWSPDLQYLALTTATYKLDNTNRPSFYLSLWSLEEIGVSGTAD